ncbi:MAG: mannose-1-phosphate guanylyltransferase [Candidatus Fermentibacteraceae bacterium]
MSDDSLSVVIMAGGRGTRFWPVSTTRRPKQFLELLGEMTMLQLTAERARSLCGPEDVYVVAGADHAGLVSSQLPWLPRENLLLEPVGRNTAACIAWSSAVLSGRGRGESAALVIPSDHRVEDAEGFAATVRAALPAAMDGWLTTIGIPPDRPATGYGYLRRGRSIMKGVWQVEVFREKPDLQTAREYLESGDYLWNAGMFLWRVDAILESLRRHLPEVARAAEGLASETAPSMEDYGGIRSISIDYGVMERARRVAMVEAGFDWDDVGDWIAARRVGAGRGRTMEVESGDCTVWNPGRLTVLLGVESLSVVETDRATLVMSDRYAQKLKEVVARLERDEPDLV